MLKVSSKKVVNISRSHCSTPSKKIIKKMQVEIFAKVKYIEFSAIYTEYNNEYIATKVKKMLKFNLNIVRIII